MKKQPTKIQLEEVNDHLDILCGRAKVSFTHLGNRRFRFLDAINVERYMNAESGRKGKSLVVESIYNQIRESGGRFLIKKRKDDTFFVEVTESVAREKISHALRDKLPADELNELKAKLQREVACSQRYGDEIYKAANARLLRIDLPDRLQSLPVPQNRQRDDRVHQILAAELEAFCTQQRRNRVQEPTLNLSYSFGAPSSTRGLYDARQLLLLSRNSGAAAAYTSINNMLLPPALKIINPLAAAAAAQSYHTAVFDASFWRNTTTATVGAVASASSSSNTIIPPVVVRNALAQSRTTPPPKQLSTSCSAQSDDLFCRQSLDDFGKMHDDHLYDLDALSDLEDGLGNDLDTDFTDEDCYRELGDVLDFAAVI